MGVQPFRRLQLVLHIREHDSRVFERSVIRSMSRATRTGLGVHAVVGLERRREFLFHHTRDYRRDNRIGQTHAAGLRQEQFARLLCKCCAFSETI